MHWQTTAQSIGWQCLHHSSLCNSPLPPVCLSCLSVGGVIMVVVEGVWCGWTCLRWRRGGSSLPSVSQRGRAPLSPTLIVSYLLHGWLSVCLPVCTDAAIHSLSGPGALIHAFRRPGTHVSTSRVGSLYGFGT
ncbi:hypothetical protein BU24DRAFT_233230 [Aaosphaeria arxii CBS 175.79]|uniref:Uncharacterized protein n=1 Tax=Aaosphaeria arxii CBS 175.79 TaxID=1450172 RepID=A0A6A5XKK0_9PLEO|nr:uncharacterized protein BU24DRAFT_233230 [Aaosphaeria arxii CBS 175.79]KAF2013260.1 hypothetical protein BU24DRAFT_233230 [Aaosphaeria arxii CBS 175.79]